MKQYIIRKILKKQNKKYIHEYFDKKGNKLTKDKYEIGRAHV